ncbi:hypothetical protein P7C70_g7786, partial [Phenoliferia sp. Uapishka_3]
MAFNTTKVFKLRSTNPGEASARRLTPSLTSAAMAPAATSTRALSPRRSLRDRNKSSPPKSTNPSQRSLVAAESSDDSDSGQQDNDRGEEGDETVQGRDNSMAEERVENADGEDDDIERGKGKGKRVRSKSVEAQPTPSLDLHDMDAQEAMREAEESCRDLRERKRQKVDQQFKATGGESPLTDLEELERREAALLHVPAFTPIPPTQTQHPASPAPATAGSPSPSAYTAPTPTTAPPLVHTSETIASPAIVHPVAAEPVAASSSKTKKKKTKTKSGDAKEDPTPEPVSKPGKAKGKGKKKVTEVDDVEDEAQSEPELDAATEALEASQFMADREEAAAEAQKHRFQGVVFKVGDLVASFALLVSSTYDFAFSATPTAAASTKETQELSMTLTSLYQ